jgi:hypothetical protein
LLPNEDVPITLFEIEQGEGVRFVSGMQGVIATMYMAEDYDQIPGENNPQPVCILAELVTPMDFFMPKVTIPS